MIVIQMLFYKQFNKINNKILYLQKNNKIMKKNNNKNNKIYQLKNTQLNKLIK